MVPGAAGRGRITETCGATAAPHGCGMSWPGPRTWPHSSRGARSAHPPQPGASEGPCAPHPGSQPRTRAPPRHPAPSEPAPHPVPPRHPAPPELAPRTPCTPAAPRTRFRGSAHPRPGRLQGVRPAAQGGPSFPHRPHCWGRGCPRRAAGPSRGR